MSFTQCMILSNVRLLRNKKEELCTNMRVSCKYGESSMQVFSETWLHHDIPDSLIELKGFSPTWADRTKLSGKSRGVRVRLL